MRFLLPVVLSLVCASAQNVPHEVLLRMKEQTDRNDLEDALSVLQGRLLRSYHLVPMLHHVETPFSPREARRLLQANPKVLSVRPNRTVRPARREVPTDPQFGLQWGLHNTGQVIDSGISGTAGVDIKAAPAWDFEQGEEFVIAVLDSGLYLGHEDIEDNVWVNVAERDGVAGVDDDGNGFVDDVNGWSFVATEPQLAMDPVPTPLGTPDVSDVESHGTEVASILGARGGNEKGMVGVNWECRIMPLGIFSTGMYGLEGTIADAIAALEYAVDMGVLVSNNSWGAPEGEDGVGDFADLGAAIEAAGVAGHLFVTGAGNGGADIDVNPYYPASFELDNMLTVTGIDYDDDPSGFNFGATKVHIAAPAELVLTAHTSGPAQYIFPAAGTSYAAPHVAGAAALLWQFHPTWSYGNVRHRILDRARQIPALSGRASSRGVLDLRAVFPDFEFELIMPAAFLDAIRSFFEGLTGFGFGPDPD